MSIKVIKKQLLLLAQAMSLVGAIGQKIELFQILFEPYNSINELKSEVQKQYVLGNTL
jgi:hypothetical protein